MRVESVRAVLGQSHGSHTAPFLMDVMYNNLMRRPHGTVKCKEKKVRWRQSGWCTRGLDTTSYIVTFPGPSHRTRLAGIVSTCDDRAIFKIPVQNKILCWHSSRIFARSAHCDHPHTPTASPQEVFTSNTRKVWRVAPRSEARFVISVENCI